MTMASFFRPKTDSSTKSRSLWRELALLLRPYSLRVRASGSRTITATWLTYERVKKRMKWPAKAARIGAPQNGNGAPAF